MTYKEQFEKAAFLGAVGGQLAKFFASRLGAGTMGAAGGVGLLSLLQKAGIDPQRPFSPPKGRSGPGSIHNFRERSTFPKDVMLGPGGRKSTVNDPRGLLNPPERGTYRGPQDFTRGIKSSSYASQFSKEAGIGTRLGRSLLKGGIGLYRGAGGQIGPEGLEQLVRAGRKGLYSNVGRGALGLGATATAAPLLTGFVGNRKGRRQGYNTAIGDASNALDDVYGGFQGRLNALLGGARPGQDALLALAGG